MESVSLQEEPIVRIVKGRTIIVQMVTDDYRRNLIPKEQKTLMMNSQQIGPWDSRSSPSHSPVKKQKNYPRVKFGSLANHPLKLPPIQKKPQLTVKTDRSHVKQWEQRLTIKEKKGSQNRKSTPNAPKQTRYSHSSEHHANREKTKRKSAVEVVNRDREKAKSVRIGHGVMVVRLKDVLHKDKIQSSRQQNQDNISCQQSRRLMNMLRLAKDNHCLLESVLGHAKIHKIMK